jgi:hypothetical protein
MLFCAHQVLLASWWARIAVVFRRPEHGPGIDVEELTFASGAVLATTLYSGIISRKITPIIGNTSVFQVG